MSMHEFSAGERPSAAEEQLAAEVLPAAQEHSVPGHPAGSAPAGSASASGSRAGAGEVSGAFQEAEPASRSLDEAPEAAVQGAAGESGTAEASKGAFQRGVGGSGAAAAPKAAFQEAAEGQESAVVSGAAVLQETALAAEAAAVPEGGADVETLALETASPDELPQVAAVIDEVSEGVCGLLLSGLIAGVSPVSLLCMALNSPNPSLSLRNVLVLRDKTGLKGLALCYPAREHRIPPILRTLVPGSRLEELAPLLEEAAEGSLYLHTLWVSAQCRGQHLGELLIEAVCLKAQAEGLTSVSLHCFKGNAGALKFYAAQGFEIFRELDYTGRLKELHPAGGVILKKILPATDGIPDSTVPGSRAAAGASTAAGGAAG